jgi:hypothetical protein
VWEDGRGMMAPPWGDLDHLRREARGLPAVHQARQPRGIARLKEVTHIRPTDDPRRVPHLPCHAGHAVGMGDQHRHIHHQTGVPSAWAHRGPFGAGADTPDPFGGAYTWAKVPSCARGVAS